MKIIIYLFLVFISTANAGCSSDKKVESLLNSKDKDDLISGSMKAGKKGKEKFVSLLLKNADDPRRSTNLKFKGVSVYEAKMRALGSIFKQFPPIKITEDPDSQVINYYINLSQVKLKK